MSAYNVIDRIQIEPHILFIRIEPIDIKITLREVFKSLSDISWISDFDKQYIQDYFRVRAEETINYIGDNIIAQSEDKITGDTGELVVSELSRLAVINEMRYLDIPLAELIKSQSIGKCPLLTQPVFCLTKQFYLERQNLTPNETPMVQLLNRSQDLKELSKMYQILRK